ncbi:FtsX-like permease family protein [candidate division WWE3 bacterium]|jgi:putative ABC transport system permease protein|uniref:FtsX-like permease family protein n=1 Tax=candidate division WWE3 bacterium TaxID=2053526 RepID=A0A3A4ZIU3_UNCKA|nr:MAG: FtsX-like permease family protein [candidate division WWE3 bacterium]
MKLIEIFEESVIVLKTNKLRTALSMLGIIIGIGSVISLMSLGAASQQSVKERIQSLGSNLLTIRPGSNQQGFLRGGSSVTTLTNEDAEAIKTSKRFTTIDKVAAVYSAQTQVVFEGNNTNVSILGITSDYFDLNNIEIEYGFPITDDDLELQNKVAVLGTDVIEDLFENKNPIGSNVRINGTAFKVIGIIKSKGFGTDGNIFIPLSTAQKSLFGVSHVSSIYVSAKEESLMNAAENQLGFFLLERHGFEKPEDADFTISSQSDILETANEITQTFTTLLTGIAAISLVVGGIGIMNIMLVTVTERTREIGIRKALGAKRKAIITQFLIEAIVLTITGGLIGVMLGVGVSYLLTKVMSMSFVISVNAIGLAFGVSALIGILFGWYPAQKAARLQPIEALRYE